MKKLLEQLLTEISVREEGYYAFWISPKGKKITVPNHKEHSDLVRGFPELFNLTDDQVSKADSKPSMRCEVNILAMNNGAVAITYERPNKQLDLMGVEFKSSILDNAIMYCKGNPQLVIWVYGSKLNQSIDGTVDEIYNRL